MTEVALERAAELLAREGWSEARLEVLGHERDVLAVTAPASARSRLAALAPRLRELGFRYITLDLEGPSTVDGPHENGVS